MNRRGFLQSILAAGVAPAVVGSGILMPVRSIVPLDITTTLGEYMASKSDPLGQRGYVRAQFWTKKGPLIVPADGKWESRPSKVWHQYD